MKRSVTRKRNEFYTKNFCALNSAGFPDCPDEEKQSQAEDQDWDNVVERDGDQPAQEVIRRNELATVKCLD